MVTLCLQVCEWGGSWVRDDTDGTDEQVDVPTSPIFTPSSFMTQCNLRRQWTAMQCRFWLHHRCVTLQCTRLRHCEHCRTNWHSTHKKCDHRTMKKEEALHRASWHTCLRSYNLKLAWDVHKEGEVTFSALSIRCPGKGTDVSTDRLRGQVSVWCR